MSPNGRRANCAPGFGDSCRCGEIGRLKGLKIPRWQHRTGSSPVTGTRMPLFLRVQGHKIMNDE